MERCQNKTSKCGKILAPLHLENAQSRFQVQGAREEPVREHASRHKELMPQGVSEKTEMIGGK